MSLNTAIAGNDFVQVQPYSISSGTVTSGMYDMRRAKGMGLTRIDMGKLKTIVDKNDANDWGGDVTKQKPDKWWNGVVYVKYPTTTTSRSDNVTPAVNTSGNYWGVQLHNGSTIPMPGFAVSKGIHGTTVATNQPLYIQGHFNADGNSATGAGGAPDNTNEPVAAVAADAVTILSTAWSNANSAKTISNRNASSFTEVSAAILSGIVPSDNANNGVYSGGVENFPRFLESWSGDTFRYRGSMVALYESEIANEPWAAGGGSVYSPPARDWSFNTQFGQGKYPPGTPNTRTFRRVNSQEINKAKWDSDMATLKTVLGI